jgi:hypothetical protein
MNEQQIFDAVQNIFRDNFDDDSLVLTRETTADDIEDWDSLEQINLLTPWKSNSASSSSWTMCAGLPMWATWWI